MDNYIRGFLLHFNRVPARPLLQSLKCSFLHLGKHFLKARRPEEIQHHVLEVLVHEPMQRAHILPPEDLREGVGVPALEQVSLLLEHKVAEVGVC